MELTRFVRVVVERAGKIGGGTGYLLHGDRVLTARHVVEGAESLSVEYSDELGSGPVYNTPARVCWKGSGELDVAVLSIDTSLRIARQVLGPVVLADDQPWRSRGWSVAAVSPSPPAKATVVDSMSGLSGEAYQFSEGAQGLELEVKAPPSAATNWCGISGAPVFCGDQLVAVIRDAEEVFKGSRLKAVPIAALWESEGFREHIGHDAGREELRAQRQQELIADLAEILEQNDAAASALADTEQWREIRHRDGDRGLAKALCTTVSWRELATILDRAHDLESERSGRHAAAAADAIKRLALRVVPEVYASTELHITSGSEGGGFVRLPVATATMAELAMAAYDGRLLAFQDVKSRQHYPSGLSSFSLLESSSESSFDFGQAEGFRQWLLLLAQWLKIEENQLAFASRPEQLEELVALVNLQLKRDLDFREPRRYFLFSQKFSKENGALLTQIRDRVRAVHLVPLDGRHSPAAELSSCAPILNILFRSLQKKRKNS